MTPTPRSIPRDEIDVGTAPPPREGRRRLPPEVRRPRGRPSHRSLISSATIPDVARPGPVGAGGASGRLFVPVFAPGWQYRRRMLWNGKRVVVRQLDGVHLGHEGVKIATDLAVDALV